MSKAFNSGLMKGAAALAAGAAMLAAPGTANAQVPDVVTFAVPPAGTSGYILTTAYSKVLREKTPIKKVVMQTFGGAAGWPARMQTGEVNFGSHCGFKLVQEAYFGHGPFKSLGRQKNVLNMITGHGLPFAMSVIDPKIKGWKDLKGKRVFALMTHADQATALRVAVKHVGLDLDKDVKVIRIRSPREALQGLRTGRGDGMFYGLIPPLAEIKRSKGLHALSMSDDMMQAILKAEPVWGTMTVPKGRPPLKLDSDVKTIQIQCGVAAGAKTNAETVYQVTRTVLENLSAWNSVHPLAKQWSLKRAVANKIAPYHEGAIRYYKEKGVWTKEHEEMQKKLTSM